MGKPFDEEEDEDGDALSVIMGGTPSGGEDEEDEPATVDALEPPEEEGAQESDASQVLDEVMAKLEELRGLVTSL